MKLRKSVKVILLNDKNEIAMLFSRDNKICSKDGKFNGKFWYMVGGGIEPGEDVLTAAKREVFEETGITSDKVTFGPIVWYGEVDLTVNGEIVHFEQQFIIAHTKIIEFNTENFEEDERETVEKLAWRSLDEIKNSAEVVYPCVLAENLEKIIDGNIPSEPIWIDLEKRP